jgi:cell fate regulator YaaT (PSP1 superfamily)
MEGIILVRLRDSGQVFPYDKGNLNVKEGDYVIIEHDRGQDYGHIISPNEAPATGVDAKEPPKKILRIATDADLKQI